jgi:hypothetical protein
MLTVRGYAECLRCGAVNSITTNQISDNTHIACSHCRADLGPWRQIKESSPLEGTKHAEDRSRL